VNVLRKWLILCTLLFVLILSACGTEIIQSISLSSNITDDIIDIDASNKLDNTSTPPAEVVEISPSPTANSVDYTQTDPDEYDFILEFPSDSYPETALHIYNAIENGHSDVCTIDREGANENRKKSLAGIDTMAGYDRDEWPMAMCAEGGEGANVAYINPSDNRGAGSWVGHQLSAYENGEKVLFIVEKPKNLFGQKNANNLNIDEEVTPTAIPDKQSSSNKDNNATTSPPVITYKNCTEAREAGAAPIMKGDPGYSKKLDRDGDGIACEI